MSERILIYTILAMLVGCSVQPYNSGRDYPVKLFYEEISRLTQSKQYEKNHVKKVIADESCYISSRFRFETPQRNNLDAEINKAANIIDRYLIKNSFGDVYQIENFKWITAPKGTILFVQIKSLECNRIYSRKKRGFFLKSLFGEEKPPQNFKSDFLSAINEFENASYKERKKLDLEVEKRNAEFSKRLNVCFTNFEDGMVSCGKALQKMKQR